MTIFPGIYRPRKNEGPTALQCLGLVAFGFFLAFLILEGSLRLAGFAILSLQAHRNAVSLRQKGAYRIMCIGESTTQGQYPPILERVLKQRYEGIKFSVIDRGMSGAHTSFLLNRLESDIDAFHPDVVVAMMGINDDGTHMPYPPTGSPAEGFASHFKTYKLARIAWQRVAGIFSDRATPGQEPAEKTIPLRATADPGARKEGDHLLLGQAYSDRGSYELAIVQFKKALELNRHNWVGYARLGSSYHSLGKLKEAEETFNEGLTRNPGEAELYVERGWFYQSQSRFKDAAKSFSRAAEIRPGYDEAYAGLGSSYQGQRDFAKALTFFGKALELNPGNTRAIEGVLWSASFARGNLSHLRPLLERIRRNPSADDKTYGALSAVYAMMGDTELARQARDHAEELRLKARNPIVAENYRRLKEILDRRGIRLACVQYPMRSIAPLKRMLLGHEEGVIFIDNQSVFQDAVKRSSFETYFQDMFAGDFGHCTERGNELLAQNIADALLKEIFGITAGPR